MPKMKKLLKRLKWGPVEIEWIETKDISGSALLGLKTADINLEILVTWLGRRPVRLYVPEGGMVMVESAGERENFMTDPEICAETVKRALRELGAATPGEVARHLGIESAPAKLLVRGILRDLKKSGGALRDGKSRYILADDPERRGSMQEQIWRAACLKAQKAKSFSLVDLALLTGASHDYLKKYVHFLAGAGFLEALGRKRHATIFRVAPGQEKELPPHWNRRAEKRRRP